MKREVFGRLGRIEDVERATENLQAAAPALAVAYPGSEVTVDRDDDAETVVGYVGEQAAFRALHKGDGVWLVIYSKEFYQKDEV